MSDAVVSEENRGSDEGPNISGAAIERETEGLSGRVGTTSVILTVMAFLAPLGAVAGYVPLVIGYGNGLGAPVVFLLCGVVIGLFSFGYLALVRQVPRPGAFYAYVSAGLGKRSGLGAGGLTIVLYVFSLVGFDIFGGISLSALLSDLFDMNLPWWVCFAVLTFLVAFCSYRGIDFNVRILGTIVAVEVAIIVLFDVAALFQGGPSGLPSEPFTWSAFSSGSVATAALFAIAFFIGFESTAIYREEVRNPARTIPRATYAVTAIIAVFYAVSAYCLITALGAENAVSATANDPAGSFTTAVTSVLGHAFSQIVSVMIVTSVLACQLAMVNGITRYVYSFSVDRVLPAALSAVHTRYGSPHRAALVTCAFTTAIVIAVALSGMDPRLAYGVFSGVSVFGFEAILLLVSLAAIVYFMKNRKTGESLWSTLIAPVLSVGCFGWLFVLSAERAELLLGTPTTLTPVLFTFLAGAFILGLGYASWAARQKPDVYARIGRSET